MQHHEKKKFFLVRHAKSSALFISLTLHAILLLVAATFVAVRVYQKITPQFINKTVIRPKLPPRKLKVPVKMKKQRPRPKARKQITVKNIRTRLPQIKLPETIGIKGGLGSGVGVGLGDAASIGFSMPEINIYGVKTRGEKVFLILDCSSDMMDDALGGMPAFEITKKELINTLRSLPPTTLFNLAVCENPHDSKVYFPKMVPATPENISKVEAWIAPLNRVPPGAAVMKEGIKKYFGLKTLGKGGITLGDPPGTKPNSIEAEGGFFRPLFHAMYQGADAVFLLAAKWGWHVKTVKEGVKDPRLEAKWHENLRKAEELLKKENEERIQKGLPPVAKSGPELLIYYKDRGLYVEPWKIKPEYRPWEPRELVRALKEDRKKWLAEKAKRSDVTTLGLKKKRDRFTINVIHFRPKDGENEDENKNDVRRFRELATKTGGRYRALLGLKAIEAAAIHASVKAKKIEGSDNE